MSPSLSESIRVGLCPDRVSFARYGRGLRPRLLEKDTLPLEPGTTQEPWRAPVRALPRLLEARVRGVADISVVLSNHFVRYLLLDTDARISSGNEWREYASHRCEKIYGARARDWDIQVSECGAPHARLASAVDRQLLTALAAAFAGSPGRLRSVQPYLMVAFNRTLPAIARASFWFVLHEPGRLLLGLIRDGRWRSLRGRRSDAGWSETLAQTLEREGALIAPEETSRDVVVCGPGADTPAAANGFNFSTLPSPFSAGEHHYAMVCA